jgi:GAF domain-containing protein
MSTDESAALSHPELIDVPGDPEGQSALRQELKKTRRELERRVEEMEDIYRAGIALSSQKDMQALYHLILQTCRTLTRADAGTLYIVDEEEDERVLVFSAAQTASLDAPYQRQVLPLTKQSIAGFVAFTGRPLMVADAYLLPPDATYTFDRSFDHAFGYRTRSVLTAPMMNLEGEVVGVVQLINRKRDQETVLADDETVDRDVEPFTSEDERVVLALASQAAVAVENRRLLETDRLYRELQEYVREVMRVTTAAASVEAGTFDPDSLEEVAHRRDPLGQLARVFQRMAREVKSREARLHQEVELLRIEIDQAKKASEVAAITQTDYFQELRRNARALRDET